MRDAHSTQRLRSLAGERSYERGQDYAATGRVSGLVRSEGTVTATVTGSDRYRVRLALDGDAVIHGSCSCPVGTEGAFCKHCVATALAVSAPHDGQALREYVQARPHGELVEFVLDALTRDDVLRDRIRLSMASGDPEAIAAAVQEIVRDEWAETWALVERLDGVLDALERHGDPHDVMAQAEHFVGVVEPEFGDVGGTVERALELHLAACETARPDPVALAERLFDLELRSDLLHDAVTVYAGPLGDAGRSTYRELADAAWAHAPDKPSWTLRRIMERLAEGDVDRLVAIKARSLEHGWDYLEIADLLHDAGRVDEALEWAERGVTASPDGRLRDFLAKNYTALGRHDEALSQRAAQFAELPSLGAYRALCAAAETLGRWNECREAALAGLDARHSDLLVSILLWEGDVYGAWEQALAGGCARERWRELARQRPADASTVYRRLLAPTIKRTNESAYREAIDLLAELHALLVTHDREAEHIALVAELRHIHARKRNLIKLLDAQAWGS